jgi:hypothetical protein
MKRSWLCLNLAVLLAFFPVAAADWYVVNEWEITAVPEDDSFGLDWKDDHICVMNRHTGGPYKTNIYIHSEDGFYLYEQFDQALDINCTGLDWKNDWDHGGKGWYLGAMGISKVFFVNENGTSYTEFDGPTDFNLIYGVVHNQDDDILYVSDWSATGRIAWGYLDNNGHVTSWTEEGVGLKYGALEYVRNSSAHDYLFGLYREVGYWDSEIHIWELDANGNPVDIYSPDDIVDFGDVFYFPGDIGWDGDCIWLLNQNYEDMADPDAVTEIALPDYLSDLTVITPTSFGRVKAQFR